MKYIAFGTFLSLLFSIYSFGQSPKYVLDSLKVQLKSAKTDQERIGIYSELTWYWAMVNLDSALSYGKESLALTQKVGDKKSIGQAYSDLGNAYNQKGQFAEAKEAYKNSLRIRTEIADSAGMAGSKSNLASVHQRLYQTDSAMMYYVQALDFYERTGNERYVNFLKNNLAVLHEDMRNFPTALKLYEEVAKYREENQMVYDLALVYNNMGNIYKAIKEFEKGEEFLSKALENGFKAGDSLVLSVTYLNIASLYNAADRPDDAIQAANQGIQIAKGVNSLYDQAMMEYALGNSFSRKKEYLQAKESYQSAIRVLEDLEAKEEVSAIQLRLVPVFAALNMPDSAQYYTDLYIDYRNQLTQEQVEQLTNEIQTKYETEKKDREIAQQQLILRNRNLQLYGSLVLALALGILGYLLYRQQKLKNAQLIQEAKLKEALAQLETQNKLQEQRLLISRDLHDNIGAQLTFIISAIENLKYFDPVKEKLAQQYDSIAGFTKQTITELRDTIWAMNSGQVTWESLAGRILDYLQKARQSSPETQFEFNLGTSVSKESKLGSAESIQVLRIIQEAVQNAVKYADATLIKVEVEKEQGEYRITVQDNGKGFVESEVSPGNGLYNMRKRAEELGGVLELSSNPGAGTLVLLMWGEE